MTIGKKLTGLLTRRGIGQAIAEESRRLFGHDAFILYIYNDVNSTLSPVYAEDTPLGESSPREFRLTLIIGRDVQSFPRLMNRATQPTESHLQPFGDTTRLSRSLMSAPIFWERRLVGLVSVQSYTPFRYAEKDLISLTEFAAKCGGALARLRAEDLQLKLIRAIDQSSSMVFITDRGGMIEYANRRFLETTGYTMEEILGRNPRFLKSGQMSATDYRNLWETALSGRDWRGEIANRKKNGELYWVDAHISPIFDSEGALTHFLCIQTDVTEHRRSLEALRRRDAILEAMSFAAERFLATGEWTADIEVILQRLGEGADVSRVYIFENLCAPQGALLGVLRQEWSAPEVENRAGQKTGLTLDFASGELARVRSSLDQGEIFWSLVGELAPEEREALAAPETRSLLLVPIFESGRWWGTIGFDECRTERRWSRAVIDALRAAAGILGAAIQRQNAMEALSQSEQTWRALLNASPVISILMDTRGRIEALNPVAAASLGRPLEQLIGANVYSLLPAEVAQSRQRRNEEVIRSGRPLRYEDERSGRIFDNSVHPVFDADGRVTRLAVFAQELTAIRRAERLAAVGMTASGLAHYIKNIQATLAGSMRLFEHGMDQRDSTILTESWPVLKRSLERINRLVKNMLALARDTKPSLETVDLNSLAQEVIEASRGRIAGTPIALHSRFDSAMPPMRLDPVRFFDALLNLVTNAIEAMLEARSSPAELTITTRFDANAQEARVRVADTGPGMSCETRQRLFEPFFTTKGERGTGLGLAMAHNVVGERGGRIEVETEPGKGCAFEILLPVEWPPRSAGVE